MWIQLVKILNETDFVLSIVLTKKTKKSWKAFKKFLLFFMQECIIEDVLMAKLKINYYI